MSAHVLLNKLGKRNKMLGFTEPLCSLKSYAHLKCHEAYTAFLENQVYMVCAYVEDNS